MIARLTEPKQPTKHARPQHSLARMAIEHRALLPCAPLLLAAGGGLAVPLRGVALCAEEQERTGGGAAEEAGVVAQTRLGVERVGGVGEEADVYWKREVMRLAGISNWRVCGGIRKDGGERGRTDTEETACDGGAEKDVLRGGPEVETLVLELVRVPPRALCRVLVVRVPVAMAVVMVVRGGGLAVDGDVVRVEGALGVVAE